MNIRTLLLLGLIIITCHCFISCSDDPGSTNDTEEGTDTTVDAEPVQNVQAHPSDEWTALITWDELDDAVQYLLFRSDECDGDYIQLGEELNNTQFEDTDVDARYTPFYYQVRGIYEDDSLSALSECALYNPFEEEDKLLIDSFRIDIKKIQVSLDLYPTDQTVKGFATVTFSMLAGQTKGVIQLDPATEPALGESVQNIVLNGETLDINNEDDIKLIEVSGKQSSKKMLEFQRDLAQGEEHTLEINYTTVMDSGKYVSIVSDIDAIGNEGVFPTIMRPAELAIHELTFTVHDAPEEYFFVGSGINENIQTDDETQQWKITSDVEVASYTMMFSLISSELENRIVSYEEREVAGILIRILETERNGFPRRTEFAFNQMEDWLPQLAEEIGPFPMPSLNIHLYSELTSASMEYYGATQSTLWALKHEVFHMYYGCSTIFKTYRDTWLDESINQWYDDSYIPIDEDYTKDIVGQYSPVDFLFDTIAYSDGARIIESIAVEVGGREKMVKFLSDLHINHSFEPMNTLEFVKYLKQYTGVDMYDEFIDWTFNGARDY